VVFSLKAFGDKILKYFYVLGDIFNSQDKAGWLHFKEAKDLANE
jgi:hypothetical protein